MPDDLPTPHTSRNWIAVRKMLVTCEAKGVTRLAIVGGSPNLRRELRALVGSTVRIRLVDGTRRLTQRDAGGIVDWADRIVILGSTQIAHRVSRHFVRDPRSRGKLVVVQRRGIEAIATEIIRHLKR